MPSGNVVEIEFRKRPAEPWRRPQGVEGVLSRWRGDRRVNECLVLDEPLAPSAGTLVPLPETLAPGLVEALEKRGIRQLFSHQADAFRRGAGGEDLVIATPTASGKSLCYNLPVLQRLTEEREARALYLFPTKALSRDQEAGLRALMGDAGLPHGAVTYDGDTPGDARRAARERSGVLITNPDMLHSGVLPHHAAWARFFAGLRYVVIDELHTYRGVFGSHLANLLRRLLRAARFHGASPVFLLASATIGNPGEHASRLIGRPVQVISESGAPAGPRQVLVYNPPVVNAELGIRASAVKSSVQLAADLVRASVPTIVFGQSRNQVEVMLKYLREAVEKDGVAAEAIQGYRGGYLSDTRRRIENGLREGEVLCVVATNALELGIDIGHLDAVICCGYPGTIAGLWQRFGRAGRRRSGSVCVLVAQSGALDQYLARAPSQIVGAPVERARIDPDNLEILLQHLRCAAFELPFEEDDPFGDVPAPATQDALGFLAENRILAPVPGPSGRRVFHWAADAYPAAAVSLRSPGWDNFAIIDVEEQRTIAEMDWRSAHTMLHEQAIYQHEGEQFQVERLDYANHKAFVRKVVPDYYTTAMTQVRVNILAEEKRVWLAAGGGRAISAGHGEVNVVEKVIGFKKIKFHTHENVGYGEVQLPEIQKPTTSLWLTFSNELLASVRAPRAVVMDALRGLGTALHVVSAMGLMTDPRDLGRALVDDAERANEAHEPTIHLYDQVPGGVGLAPRLHEEREELLSRAGALVTGCPCKEGCPSCIGPVSGAEGEGDRRGRSRKAIALELVARLG